MQLSLYLEGLIFLYLPLSEREVTIHWAGCLELGKLGYTGYFN